MKGEVEVDETFIGGKARNMHKDRNARRGRGTGGVGKAIVVGLLERGNEGSKVKAIHVPNRKRTQVEAKVRDNVEKGAEVFTAALPSRNELRTICTSLSTTPRPREWQGSHERTRKIFGAS
jgi:shikimate 5-dehydrogenase